MRIFISTWQTEQPRDNYKTTKQINRRNKIMKDNMRLDKE